MAILDMTSFDAGLKVHYTGDRIIDMTYPENPLWALLNKGTNFGGKNLPIPIIYGNPQGRSATFASAKANKTATKIDDFVLTRSKDYAIATIDNETLEASKGDANAFMEATTTEIDGAINSLARSLAIAIYRSGSGAIGQVSATPSNNASTFSVTLANAEDVTNFEVGQTLNVWSAETAGTQRSSDGTDVSWPVAAVNRDSGVLTLTGTYSGSGTFAANDYIFVEGDRGLKVKGLQAWLPYTAPTSGDSFFSLDRSVDVTRLAGIRQDGTAKPIEEAAIDLAARIGREGFSPDYFFVNFSKWASLEKALGSKVVYDMINVKGGTAPIGFRSIAIEGPRGVLKVIADQNCPADYGYALSLKNWKWQGLGASPRIFSADGLKLLRETDEDSVTVRCLYYGQLACNAPGANGVVKLS